MKNFAICRALFAATIIASLLAGCATTGSAGAAAAENGVIELRKGMATAELISMLGEPGAVDPYPSDPDLVEVWTYERTRSTTEMVSTGVNEVPFVDPITGEQRMILDPIFAPETITKSETIEILVTGETVLAWKVKEKERRYLAE